MAARRGASSPTRFSITPANAVPSRLPRCSDAETSVAQFVLIRRLALHSAPTDRISLVTTAAVVSPTTNDALELMNAAKSALWVDCSANRVTVVMASAIPINAVAGRAMRIPIKTKDGSSIAISISIFAILGSTANRWTATTAMPISDHHAKLRMLGAGSSWAAKKEQPTAAINGALRRGFGAVFFTTSLGKLCRVSCPRSQGNIACDSQASHVAPSHVQPFP